MNDSVGYYEAHAEDYAASTLNADMSRLYAEFEKYLKPGCRIMDLGSGSGRDSKYFSEQGYDVIAVDPSPAMCARTKDFSGVTTYTLKAEELFFENEFDAVWACASLLHVRRKEQTNVLQRICRALKRGGILYCSWKYGDQDRVEKERYFTDFDEQCLRSVLSDIPELRLLKNWITADVRPDQKEQKWLNVLLRKAAE